MTTGKQLNVQNATVTTATIEAKTLTIGARQVTQGIFRQLIEEPLIAEDGTLNGVPWGHVTWHPDKCGDESEHWHIVWQAGQSLRRSQVDTTPRFDRVGTGFICADYEVWAMAQIAERLGAGEAPALFKPRSSVRIEFAQDVWNPEYLDANRVRKVEGVPVHYALSNGAHEAVIKRHRLRHWDHGHPNGAVSEYAVQARAQVEAEDTAARAELVASFEGLDLDKLHADALVAIRAEAARRQRHRDVRATLAQLPQLFIGG